jgi:hypothetical protein
MYLASFPLNSLHLSPLMPSEIPIPEVASLLIRCFCIARAFFRVKCSFGFNLGDCLLPGVVGVDGGCCDVELPPAVTTAVLPVSPVKGEMVFDGDDRTISREYEAASRFFIASLYARRMAIRFARFELSAKVSFLRASPPGPLHLGTLS